MSGARSFEDRKIAEPQPNSRAYGFNAEDAEEFAKVAK